jgi:hypothetical protein
MDAIDALLKRFEAEGLDALTPDEVETLAAAADGRLEVGARLSAVATPETPLAAAVGAPSAAAWDDTWEAITRRTASRSGGRRLGMWQQVFAAVAAVLLAVGIWQGRLPMAADGRPVELDSSVEILSLEAYGEQAPMVVTVGDEGSYPVIWLVDESGA